MMRAIRALLVGALLAAATMAVAAPVQVRIDVAQRGSVVLDVYADQAPKTAAHFLALVRTGFYNGILVHRVVPDFVVQFGDPKTRSMKTGDLAGKSGRELAAMGLGAGGSGSAVPFEENGLTHETGTLSLALSEEHSATGDSQIFINLKPNHVLDGGYCVFGKVVRGMDVVKRMRVGDKVTKASVIAKAAPAKPKAIAKEAKAPAAGAKPPKPGKPEKLGPD